MLAQKNRLHLGCRHLQSAGQVAVKTGGVELGTKADHMAPVKTRALNSQVGENVHRVANHHQGGSGLPACLTNFA